MADSNESKVVEVELVEPVKPKKGATTGWMMFVTTNIDRLKKDPRGYMKAAAEEWKTNTDQAPYEAKAKAEKEKYDEEMRLYKEKIKEFKSKGGVVKKPQRKLALHGVYPLARVQKILKLDTDIKKLSGKAVKIIAKAAEMFTSDLAFRVYDSQVRPRGTKTVQLKDLASCIHRDQRFRFLDADFALPDPTERKKQKTRKTKKIEPIPGTQKIGNFFATSTNTTTTATTTTSN